MPTWIELRLAVQGVFRLARFNPDFQRFFDRSPRAALRSFWVALPNYAYFLVLVYRSDTIAKVADQTQFVAAVSVGYLHFWLLPPAIMTWVLPAIGRQSELPVCISVYNWLGLLNLVIGVPLLLLNIFGVPADVLSVPDDIFILASVIWEAFLFVHILRLALWQAALASIFDYAMMHYVVFGFFLLMGGAS